MVFYFTAGLGLALIGSTVAGFVLPWVLVFTLLVIKFGLPFFLAVLLIAWIDRKLSPKSHP